MDKIMERVERLEVQCEMLDEENNKNKVIIRMLEKKLLDSDRKIQELTDKGQRSSVQNADDVKMDKRVRVLEKKMIKLEHQQQQQIQDVNEKCGKVDKLQKVFNGSILKRATTNDKIEWLSSRMDSVSDAVDDLKSFRTKTEKTQQAQAVSAATPMKSQDSPIERKLKSSTFQCMTRVRDHNLPLSEEDYCELSALESIAGIPNGPAFQFLTNSFDDNSQRAESIRQDHLKKCHTKGINTKFMAMTEYVKLCNQHTCDNHMDDTQYYPTVHERSLFGPSRILAIDSHGLRFLDPETKKECQPWNKVAKCKLGCVGVELTWTNGSTEKFYTYEGINRQVCATIFSFLRI